MLGVVWVHGPGLLFSPTGQCQKMFTLHLVHGLFPAVPCNSSKWGFLWPQNFDVLGVTRCLFLVLNCLQLFPVSFRVSSVRLQIP